MKRIEVRDLLPGDTFEYEHVPWKGQPPRVKQDRVKPIKQQDGTYVWRVRSYFDREDGTEVEGLTTLFTEIGQTNHGYVRMMPSTVVVLIAREGEDS